MKTSNSKIKIYGSTLFLIACAVSVIYVPNYITPLFYNISKTLLWVTLFLGIVFYIKRRKFSKTIAGIALFCGILCLSSLLNPNTAWQMLLRVIMSSMQLCISLKNGFSENKEKTLRIYRDVFCTAALINAATFFIYYNDNVHLRGMYVDGRGYPSCYFLGQDNGTIFYTLPAILMCALYDIEKYRKITIKTITISLIMTVSYFWVSSGNGISACVLIIASMLLLKARCCGKRLLKKVSIKTILICCLLIFATIVIFRTQNPLMNAITELLGKDLTFTGRTNIWDIVLEHISKKPLLGYGFLDDATRDEMIPYGKAHNMYLRLMFNGGIALLFVFLFMIYIVFSGKRNKLRNSMNGRLLLLYIAIYLVICNFDFYIDHPLTFLPVILANNYLYIPRTKAESETIDWRNESV